MSAKTEPRTIPEIFYNRVAATPDEEAVRYKSGGAWLSKTWRQLEAEVRAVARGLSDWVAPGEIVCIMSENRPEWWVADLAVLSIAGVSAPIYPTNPPRDIAYILQDCKAKVLIVSDAEQLEKIRTLKSAEQAAELERVIVIDEVAADEEWVLSLAELSQRNASAADPVAERMEQIGPDDLATLIYTSGTTGEPKGVMLSHNNIVSNAVGAGDVIGKLDLPDKLMLSFLPLSHSLERTAGYYAAIQNGFRVAFAESVPKLVDNMGEVRPTMLVSVPRIYEKLYSKVMSGAASGLKKVLVHWALDVGRKHAEYRLRGQAAPAGLNIKNAIAHKLVFAKVHERLGGRLQYAISGGGPLAVEIAHFLNAIGLTVFEGYGLSETSPIITANKPGQVKVGSVGTPWPDVEVKIEPEPEREHDGEILARGPNIMLGYYDKPEATREVLSADGWLRTGDIGYLDDDGFLFITDRKKELLKTAGGKYVAPQPIENNLKAHPLVEQVVLIGDRRKYCVALIVPSFEVLENTLEKPLPAERSELNNDPQVRSLYQQAVDKVNDELGRWEQIKRFYLLPQELSQETNELTPTLKPKRRVIDAKFKDVIDSLYPGE